MTKKLLFIYFLLNSLCSYSQKNSVNDDPCPTTRDRALRDIATLTKEKKDLNVKIKDLALRLRTSLSKVEEYKRTIRKLNIKSDSINILNVQIRNLRSELSANAKQIIELEDEVKRRGKIAQENSELQYGYLSFFTKCSTCIYQVTIDGEMFGETSTYFRYKPKTREEGTLTFKLSLGKHVYSFREINSNYIKQSTINIEQGTDYLTELIHSEKVYDTEEYIRTDYFIIDRY